MNAADADAKQAEMECRYITEAYDPFRRCFQRSKVDIIYDPGTAISSTRTKNSFDFRVFDQVLKIVPSLCVCAGEV